MQLLQYAKSPNLATSDAILITFEIKNVLYLRNIVRGAIMPGEEEDHRVSALIN